MSSSFCDCVNQWEQAVGLQVLKDTKYLSLRTRGEVDIWQQSVPQEQLFTSQNLAMVFVLSRVAQISKLRKTTVVSTLTIVTIKSGSCVGMYVATPINAIVQVTCWMTLVCNTAALHQRNIAATMMTLIATMMMLQTAPLVLSVVSLKDAMATVLTLTNTVVAFGKIPTIHVLMVSVPRLRALS